MASRRGLQGQPGLHPVVYRGQVPAGAPRPAEALRAGAVRPPRPVVLAGEHVRLETDHRNVRSQRAIERLGAVREGVLRHHMRRPDGSWRDTVYYSVLRAEWPRVRAGLLTRLSG